MTTIQQNLIQNAFRKNATLQNQSNISGRKVDYRQKNKSKAAELWIFMYFQSNPGN